MTKNKWVLASYDDARPLESAFQRGYTPIFVKVGSELPRHSEFSLRETLRNASPGTKVFNRRKVRGNQLYAWFVLEIESTWASGDDCVKAIGEAPGGGFPDWPEWCTSYRERKAYQCGIYDARRMPAARLPMQPIGTDTHGVVRFKENRIVEKLLTTSGRHYTMNEIAKEAAQSKYTAEEQMQFAQLIGYSVSGYCTLPYVSDESAALAKSLITVLQSTHTTTEPKP